MISNEAETPKIAGSGAIDRLDAGDGGQRDPRENLAASCSRRGQVEDWASVIPNMRTAILLTILLAALTLACSEPTLEDVSCDSYGSMPDYETMMRYPERVGGECYRFLGYVTDVNYDDVFMNVWLAGLYAF